MIDDYVPYEMKIIDRIQEAPDVFSLKLEFSDPKIRQNYTFLPGQFNMLYLYGVGEVAISIVSDPEEKELCMHTIRAVGRVTDAMAALKVGDYIGLRGPYGVGWPVLEAVNKTVIVITGGLGCAPVTSAINYILKRRDQYGALKILQGVKCSSEHLFCERYDNWAKEPNTEVIISANEGDPGWAWSIGFVTDHIKELQFDPEETIVMMCGPEIMMKVAISVFLERQINIDNIYLSMERNMQCGLGHCGHCQYGGLFVCKDGPVFPYSKVKNLFGEPGF